MTYAFRQGNHQGHTTVVEDHINESVERRNFRQRAQQPGKSFDDFIMALRELTKTCKFCLDECTQKNTRDQIIKGLIDGDTVEELLQEKDLTLANTITKCRGLEAAKGQYACYVHLFLSCCIKLLFYNGCPTFWLNETIPTQ